MEEGHVLRRGKKDTGKRSTLKNRQNTEKKRKRETKKKKQARKNKFNKNLIPAVGIGDLVSMVDSLTKDSEAGLLNCVARYFIERTFDEIRSWSEQVCRPLKASENVLYVSHKLPIWEMHLFPLYGSSTPDIHELISPSVQKQSYLMTRIGELAPQMAERLRDIGEEHGGVPLPAISRILSAMVRRPDGMCFDPVAPPLRTADIAARMSTAMHCDSVLIPDAIPLQQRDATLEEISHKIHNLIAEALIIVMLSGWYDLNVIQNSIKQEAALPNLKASVWELACCIWLEALSSTTNSMDELNKALHREFSFFEAIYGLIRLYISDRVLKLAPRYASNLNDDDDPIGQSILESYTHGIDRKTKKVIKAAARSKPILALRTKKKDVSEIRIMEFQSQILDEIRKMFSGQPWQKYKLAGDPSNLRIYMDAIVRKGCQRIVQKDLKNVPGLDRTFRTHRRYNREIRTGALDEFLKQINKLGAIKRVKDMSDQERELYKKYKEMRAKHHKEGYCTQNELIKYLRDDKVITSSNQKGILLKKRSVPILRNKLNILNESAIIQCEKDKSGAYFYKEEDKERIAQAIAELL